MEAKKISPGNSVRLTRHEMEKSSQTTARRTNVWTRFWFSPTKYARIIFRSKTTIVARSSNFERLFPKPSVKRCSPTSSPFMYGWPYEGEIRRRREMKRLLQRTSGATCSRCSFFNGQITKFRRRSRWRNVYGPHAWWRLTNFRTKRPTDKYRAYRARTNNSRRPGNN